MAHVYLSREECELLTEILDNAVSDLRAEIAHTDSPFYKDRLREHKRRMQTIDERIRQSLLSDPGRAGHKDAA
jgi:hypothetical protein